MGLKEFSIKLYWQTALSLVLPVLLLSDTECQNYRNLINGSRKITSGTVTGDFPVGIVLVGQQAQEWLLHVRLFGGVAVLQLVG